MEYAFSWPNVFFVPKCILCFTKLYKYLLWILQNSLKHCIVIHDKISSVNKITWISLHQVLSVVKLSMCIRCSHWKMFMIFTNTNKKYFPHLIVKKTDGLPKVNKEVNFQNSIWIRFVPIQKWFSLHSTVLLLWKDYILQLSEKKWSNSGKYLITDYFSSSSAVILLYSWF